MVKASRYILIITAIAGFSIVLPKLYWMAFSKPVIAPFVRYSCIDNDFVSRRIVDGIITWKDAKGNALTREEFEKKLPLLYVRQLLINNSMPDSIYGSAISVYNITLTNSNFLIQPKDLDSPPPGLYPLFESKSGRTYFELPDDYFRITWRMEFIDAKSNKILEEKSQMFSAVLYNKGFEFPAKSINGIPNIKKNVDEGYFVVDSKDQLFHIKMINGEPYVRKVELPKGLTFKYISCVDFEDRKFYAYLFSTDNELYILTQNDYNLIKFPVSGIDPAKNEVRIYSDLFHYNILVYGDNIIHDYVVNTNYNFVNEYKETWLTKKQRKEGKIFQSIFPEEISLTNSDSNFINFFTDFNTSLYWIVLSIVLIGIQFYIVKWRKQKVKNNILDLIIVGVFGIFGFLAVNIFPNKFYE